MAPQKRARHDKREPKLKQTSLLDHMSSSPPEPTRSSPAKPKSRSPTKSQRRLHASHNSDDDESSDIGAIKFEPLQSLSDEKETSKKQTPASKRRKVVVASDDESEGEVSVPRIACSSRKQKHTRFQTAKVSLKKRSQPDSTTDSDDVPVQPKRKRRLIKGERASSPLRSEESEDLGTDHILNDRFRARGKQTTFQKNLEKLKRRKQGKPMELSEPESENAGSADEDFVPFEGAKPRTGKEDGSYDQGEDTGADDDVDSEDDFIVEDDGDASAELPLEFSMESHQDLSHQFKKIFQLFVHVATRQPSDRHDFMLNTLDSEEYFSVPLQMFRRKLLGLRDSLVASSVWRPEFKKALERHPDFDLVHLDFAFPGCDACHLGARMSTYSARLSGKKYDRLGYEVRFIYNSRRKGMVEFNLGRFCAKRTQVYHDITHWEYTLFKSVDYEVRALQGDEDKGFVRVAFIGGRKPPEDTEDADAICEWLDERKVIDIEWQRLNGVMDNARNLEMMAKRGQDLD
ncbi:hypothetical protein L218DRAFT_925102 [Marasmius fiardii PR-910]|nr:hypothetical protein L218DRAFT_925102 [Marasmius fiardii PR-910]